MIDEMWSLSEEARILRVLSKVQQGKFAVTVWQSSQERMAQLRGKIKSISPDRCVIAFSKVIPKDYFINNTNIFCHCDGVDIIFKKENFNISRNELVFKTPTKLMIREKRRVQRFRFKYQDFKEVQFTYHLGGEVKCSIQTLHDLSILGLGFLAPRSLVSSLRIGDEIDISMMTDQKINIAPFKAKIVNMMEFNDGGELNGLVKYGVEFESPMEMISYNTIDSAVPKTQKLSELSKV